VIRFSAFLVVAAVGTLVAGVVTSKLLLVYIAIGVSGLALLALGAGAAVHWRELTGKGKPETAAEGTMAAAGTSAQAPVSSSPPAVVPPQVATPEAATAASRPAWSGAIPAGSSRPGYLPPEPPAATRPTSASEWKWRDDPAPREPAKPAASLTGQRDSRSAVAEDQPSVPDDDLSVQDQTMIFRAQPDQTMIFRAQPAASTAKPEPAPAPESTVAESTPPQSAAPQSAFAESAAAEETARPSDDRDAEPAAEASAPANAAAADGTATADDTSSADGAGPADGAAPSDEAVPGDEPEPADDATTITKAAAPGAAPASDLEVTVVPGVPRYHKANCILIRFMGDSDLDKMTVAGARAAGCTPCRACLPDQSEESPELSGAPEPEPQA
jgi:hypothetical protein